MIKSRVGFAGAVLAVMAHERFMIDDVYNEPIIFSAPPPDEPYAEFIRKPPMPRIYFNSTPFKKGIGNSQRKRRKLVRQNPNLLRTKKYKHHSK